MGMEVDSMKETRVGYATTSILEGMCLAYIKSNMKDGKFKGDWNYLMVYDQLRRYNERN